MTKVYCDQCGEMIPSLPSSGRIFTLSEKDGEVITVMSTPWTSAIKVERNHSFELCQCCLDDVIERACKLFLEIKTPKKSKT